MLEDRVKVDDQKSRYGLVQMYSNMKAPQAAKVFETMDEDLAVEILGRMKKKNAADIMNLLKPEKAQVLSEMFAGYKRRSPPAQNSTSEKKLFQGRRKVCYKVSSALPWWVRPI